MIFILSLLALVGCQSEKLVNDGGSQGGQMITLTASKGIMSRTHLGSDGKKTVWSEDDQIYVSSANGKVTGVLTLSSKPGEAIGQFTGYILGGEPEELTYSVFPVPSNGKTIDLSQVVGGDKLNAPMIGQIENGNVPFENTCGILRLNLQNANEKNFTISAKKASNDEATKLLTTATVKVVDGVAKLEYTSSSTGTISLNNAVGGFMYVPYFINENVDVYVDDIEVATIEKEKIIDGETVDFIGAIKQEDVKTLVFSENADKLIEPSSININKTQNVSNQTLTLNISSVAATPDQDGNGSSQIQEVHEFVNVPSITEAFTGEGDTEVEVTNVVVELPKITETSTATKSVVSFEEIPQGITVKIQDEQSTETNKTESVEQLTIILPSGTTAAEAKQAVEINMPNTTVIVKSADGNILLINEMTAKTADNTLIVDKDVVIKSLTIEQGSVQVFGRIDKLIHDAGDDVILDVTIEVGGSIGEWGEGFNVVDKNAIDEPAEGTVMIRNAEFSTILKEVLGNEIVTLNGQGYAVIKKTDADNVKVLNLGIMVGNNKYLPSLSGIENFTNLEEFYFRNEGSSLTSIDFSKNVKLKNLQLVFANPGTLDLSKNVNLESLLLVHMHINTLDLSKNVKLKSINLNECHLTSLDITALSALEDLSCNNQLDENFSNGIDLTVTMTQAQMEHWINGWKNNNLDRVSPYGAVNTTILSRSIIEAQQDPTIAERIAVYNWASAARISGENTSFLAVGRFSDSYNSMYHDNYIRFWIENASKAIALSDDLSNSLTNNRDKNFNKNLKAFARIWRTVMIAEYADNFGPYPLAGFKGDNTIYNSVKDVYYYMLEELKEAVESITLTVEPTVEEAANDPLFDFKASQWIKYGNSLRLRLAMRLSEVDGAKAKSEFEAVDKSMLITTMDDIAKVKEYNQWNAWAGIYSRGWNYITLPSTMSNILVGLGGIAVSEQRADLAQYTKPMDYLGLQFVDHYADKTDNPTKGYWLDGIPENLDPRALRIYCLPNDQAADNFKNYGSVANHANYGMLDDKGEKIVEINASHTWNYYPAGSRSAWSPKFAKNQGIASAYQYVLPVLCKTYGGDSESDRIWFGPWETHFLLAEAALYGWNAGTTAKAAYEQGVRVSFESFGVSQYVDAYLASEDYNRVGVSVAFDHVAEPTNFTANYVNGYTNEAGTTTYEYPDATKALYKGGKLNDQLSKIITQKYIAQAPYCTLEIWNDQRRLGLPWFDMPNNETIFKGTDMVNTWSPDVYLAGQTIKVYPQRLRYPENLPNANSALQQLGGENTTQTPLWWAISEGSGTQGTTSSSVNGNNFGNGGVF